MPFNSTIQHPDFVVTSAAGKERLIIEVKKWRPQNELLSQLIESTFAPRFHYFLLVTPEEMQLWPPAGPGQAVLPATVPSRTVLANYLTIERYPLQGLSEQELSFVVSSWLGSIMFKPAATLRNMPGQAWVVDSGLHQQIYRGFIRREHSIQ